MVRKGLGFILVALALFGIAACSSDGGNPETTSDVVADSGGEDALPAGTIIGPEGGSVALPDGTTLTVPEGALAGEVAFEIQAANLTPATLPGALTPVSAVVTVLPAGTLFDPPATLTIPWDPARLPDSDSEDQVAVYTAASLDGPWEALPTQVTGEGLTAEVAHLSDFLGASGCRTSGQGCEAAAPCCNPLVCHAQRCGDCRMEGESASSNSECCPGLVELDGKCGSCVPSGGNCDFVTNCCDSLNAACIGGKCTDCLPEGSSCDLGVNCCGGLFCVDGVCTGECAQPGEGCSSEFDCCGADEQDLQCAGNVCTSCSSPGEPCTAGDQCCKGAWCDEQCEACREPGESCPYNHACCNGRCEDSTCVTCFSTAQPCNVDGDCCSGSCDDHVCAVCPVEGAACGAKGDCCPGGCCDEGGSGLNCVDNVCTRCQALGAGCEPLGPGCCGDLLCIDGSCSECREAGGACEGSGHCCGDLICWQSACEACHDDGQPCAQGGDCCDGSVCDDETKTCRTCAADGEACDEETPCCGNTCLNNICQGCVEDGQPCETGQDCCSGGCVDNVCVPCAGFGEECDGIFVVCCEFFECNGGTCDWACGLENASCGMAGDKECCAWFGCFGGSCKECGDSGDNCGDGLNCCDDLECIDGACQDEPQCAALGQSCADLPCCDGAALCDTQTKICQTQSSGGGPCDPAQAPFDGNPQFGQAHVEYSPTDCTCKAGSGYSGDPQSIAVDYFGTPMGGVSPEPPWTIQKTEPDIGSGPWLETVPKNTPLTLWLHNPETGQTVKISFIYTDDGIVDVSIEC